MTLLWAADFTAEHDSNQADFGNVQRQIGGSPIVRSTTPIPGYTHPTLGYCLKLHLAANEQRLEAAPKNASNLGEGDERYFRVDFVLGMDFPIEHTDTFCLINQIHQGESSGSPPIEFDVHDSALWVAGSVGSTMTYNHRLVDVRRDARYSLVYRVKFSATAANCLLECWLDGTNVLPGLVPPSPNLMGGNSYWKGATMYCRPSIPPLTVYETNHRVGTTYADVALLADAQAR